jgi:endonuclease/exonuclease/phosphatase family metal-dependent hydrolase
MSAVELRLLSWNLHALKDDRRALTSLVRDLDPDVMCVQEAPKFLRWRAKAAALARECGLLYVTGGGTTGGTALLASLRVDVRRSAEMPLSFYGFGWPDRGVAAAVVDRRGARLGVASLHLPLPATERLDHARRVVEVLRLGGSEHLFAAGDVNERPAGPVWGWLAEQGLRDLGPGTGHTFPAVRPDRRIDGAFATEGVEVVDYRVVDDPRALVASDHRPLLVTVRVPGAQPSPGRSPAR